MAMLPIAKPSFSRTDPAYARYVFEKLLPNEGARQVVLQVLADCIREHTSRPDGWGITLHGTEVGLNVGGGYYALHILDKQVRPFFLAVPGDESLTTDFPFKTPMFADVKRTWIAEENVSEWLPILSPGVLAFVHCAAEKGGKLPGGSRQAHSPGVLRYIEVELGLSDPLPDPSYPPVTDSQIGQQHWAIQANPTVYDIYRALKEQKTDTWMIANSNVKVGDRLLIWKSRGNELTTGIIALAEVIGQPHIVKPSNPQYFLRDYTEEQLLKERALIRYVTSAKLPLWKENLPPELVDLTVAKGIQGNTFKVTEPQWEALMEHIGGWPGETGYPNPEPVPLPDFPRNTILYGPPGTGKTFSTILKAVEIIDGTAPETMEEAKARWDALRASGRIEFVTFHQSYGYEDFVEGIRPVMDDTATTPRYEVCDGILKTIALRALGAMLEPLPVTQEMGAFDQVWKAFREEYDANPERTYKGLTEATEYRLTAISNRGAIRATNVRNMTAAYNTSIEKLRKVYDTYRNTTDKITTSQVQEVIGSYGHHILTATLYRELKRIADSGKVTPETATLPATEPEYRASAYLESGNQSAFRLKEEPSERFVLVIDEINRGNISKVFGELITLIEDDKRIGADLAMTVTLPFSREAFGLPENLYILGTMNTADKSIALVDVALRRRFEFEELMPDFTVCESLTDDMRRVLNELNRRIVLRKDRDHQIGHAFFIRVSDAAGFNRAFEKKVIPLLQEYFYGDWESLRFVLGEKDDKPQFIYPLEGVQTKGARNRWQWYRDAGKSVGILDALIQNYPVTQKNTETDEN